MTAAFAFDDDAVVAARPGRNALSPWKPYAFCVEEECGPSGNVEPVATLFLTNRECPFRCVMCDLWKNTLTERVPVGAIPAQIEFALERLPRARHIKLYNSGNFFDARAIPPEDHDAIADRVAEFETVIVENHPKLCGRACAEFQQRLNDRVARSSSGEGATSSSGEVSQDASARLSLDPSASLPLRHRATSLEVAIGLETIHPDVLPRLNKRMTIDDYDRAVGFLRENGIEVRTFVLLSPPYLAPELAEEWCLRSVEHAFAHGARVCSIIPTRGGNGAMERLAEWGMYRPPSLGQLESVFAAALRLRRGRVFVDLWDVQRLADCSDCAGVRIARLQRMNRQQRIEPTVACERCAGSA